MSIFTAYSLCTLCEGRSAGSSDNPLLVGNPEAKILAIVSADQLSNIHDPEIPTLERLAITATVSCGLDTVVEQENIDLCAIYTRTITYAFSHFIVTEEAWDQLGFKDDFEDGSTKHLPIGVVRCTSDILNVIEDDDFITEFESVESNKVTRKRIITLE